jgi:hypothetical protein
MLHDTRFHQGLSQNNFSYCIEYEPNVISICGAGNMRENLFVRITIQAGEFFRDILCSFSIVTTT